LIPLVNSARRLSLRLIQSPEIEERVNSALLLLHFLDALFQIHNAALDLLDDEFSRRLKRRRQIRIGYDLFSVVYEDAHIGENRRHKTYYNVDANHN